MAILDELVAVLGYDLQGEDDLRKWNRGIDQAQKNLDGFARAAGAMAIAVGAAMAAAGAAIGNSVIQTNAQFEQFEATLTTIEGSAEKARSSMDWITDFAITTPYELGDITDAFVRLKAYGIDPIDGTLETLGDTAAAMGKPLMDSVEMFADAATFQFERLRSFGITASQAGDQVTFSWNENGVALSKTIKKNSDDVRTFLEENLGRRFSGAMEMQSKTWNGIVSNIGDTWTKFQKQIGDAGFFDAMKDRLGAFLETLDVLAQNGTLDRWATTISDVLVGAVERLDEAFSTLAADAQFLWGILSGMDPAVLDALAISFGLLMWRAFPLAVALGAVALAIEDIVSYLRGADESIFGSFVQWIQDVSGMSAKAAENVGFLAAAIAGLSLTGIGRTLLWTGIRAGAMFIGGLAGAITGAGALVLAVAGGVLIWAFWDSIKEAVDGLPLADVMTAIEEAFTTGDWSGVGEQLMASLLEGMQAVGDRIKDWFRGLFEIQMPEWLRQLFPDSQAVVGAGSSSISVGGGTGGGSSAAQIKLSPDAQAYKDQLTSDSVLQAFQRYQANTGKMDGATAANAVMNDNRVDSRDQSNHTTIEIGGTTVHVQSATQAPAAVGRAIGEAIGGAARQSTPARVQQNPHF